ncbi:MAG: hypothetical protein AB1422_13590 [bacterium]
MDEEYIGYLKYEGKLIEDGLLDARKAAQALLGFDEAIRFFVGQQSPSLRDLDFEIPVRLRKGSWEALIPTSLIDWVVRAVGVGVTTGVTTYLVTAAKKMADKDFEKKGLKDIFVHAVEAIQWTIRIGKHLDGLIRKKFENPQFRNENTEIGIPNQKGEYLFIPKKFFEFYIPVNPGLLKKMAELIEEERRLEIGVYKNGELIRESIPYQQRRIFTLDVEEEILFPELVHGQEVTLEGHITKGNENTNSLGFMYKDHILACYPETGSIVNYKNAIFVNCRIYGSISRLDDFGGYNASKPKIIFSKIEALDTNAGNLPLF